MKKISVLSSLFFLLLSTSFAEEIIQLQNGKQVLLMDNFTWAYVETDNSGFDYSSIRDNQIPDFLRGGITCNSRLLKTAIKMYFDGWRYTMPRPKSNQARWGNSDGRTTWWYGYWSNEKTGIYSSSTPKKIRGTNSYVGDRQNNSGSWRRGGSPSIPTKLEWLLSKYGGIAPR